MASYIGYAAWSAMRRSTATTAMSAWLSFLPSHILGDVAVVVWSVLYRWVLGVEWSWYQVGRTVAGPAPMACVSCGRRGGGRRVAWGVVLGCGLCAVVEVDVLTKFIVWLRVGLLSLGCMGGGGRYVSA